ncbi:MAG: GNAT family N-acetyltransferase [Alphaproteobacteria bacterium]|nr:MAG: GNAT family N-acetyltransferase [Alphaproteobacteria bacterium]
MTLHTFTVRPMQQSDADALCTLHRRAIRHNHGQLYSKIIVEDWANSRTPDGYWRNHLKGESFLVALIDDQPVGFIGWKDGELCGLYINPDHQRRNIGSALVIAADVMANANNQPIRTVVTGSATAFYEKHGFHLTGETTFSVAGHTLPCTSMARR